MKIAINECNATRYGDTILALLAECDNGKIDNLLEEVVSGNTHYSYASVKFNGNVINLISSYKISENAIKTVNKIKRLPVRYRNIPNDRMIIEVDEFERELFINLDGE